MLLPEFHLAAPIAAILFETERDMPHGFFGDRDAGPPFGSPPGTRRVPPGCGLFGRRGDAPPLPPANGARPSAQDEPRGRA